MKPVLLWGLIIALSFAVLVSHLSFIGGTRYLQTHQLKRHLDVMRGTAESPWAYRILPEWLTELAGKPFNDILKGMLLLRFGVTVMAFWFAVLWWKHLGISYGGFLSGVVILGYAFFWTFFDSDLSSGTFLEVALCSALCLWPWLSIPLGVLSALNRETTIIMFIGLLLWAFLTKRNRIVYIYGLIAFLATLITVHLCVGPRASMLYYGNHIGREMVLVNFRNPDSWLQLVRTFSLIPLIIIFWWKEWPISLKCLAVIAPLWFAVTFIGGAIQETRVVLTPFVLVFLPAFLIYTEGR